MTAPAEDPRGGEACDAVLVDGDWVSPSYEAHARDLTKSWADAAQNAGCPSAFVSRMRAFVDVHDRNHRAALAARPAGDRAQPTEELREQLEQMAAHKIAYVNAPQLWGRSKVVEAVLALPAVAALLDAQAKVERVEALAKEYERTPPSTVTRDRDVALDIRAALAPQAADGAR